MTASCPGPAVANHNASSTIFYQRDDVSMAICSVFHGPDVVLCFLPNKNSISLIQNILLVVLWIVQMLFGKPCSHAAMIFWIAMASSVEAAPVTPSGLWLGLTALFIVPQLGGHF